MSYVVAVANEKGGVAKTTTALSVGGALSQASASVLLIDLDPQANLTMSLGFQPSTLNGSIADVLLADRKLTDVCRGTRVGGVSLAPSNHDIAMAERYLDVRDNYERILQAAVASVPEFDFIILDCPPALGPVTQSALTAADLLVIPTQCEYFSAHGVREVLYLVRAIRERLNPLLRYRLLLTMVDRRNRIHRHLEDQIRNAFGRAVFETVIEVDTRLREGPIFAKPITAYAPESRAAEQYTQLAKDMRSYAEESLRPAKKSA
jgi:chromosome partitioning protein